jgi:hypothetical protein
VRDTQRARVYRAEHAIHNVDRVRRNGRVVWKCACPERFTTVAEVAEMANWFAHETRSGRNLRATRWLGYPYPIKVKDGRGSRNGRGGGWTISMPIWSRCPLVIAHEVAHCLVPRSQHSELFTHTHYRLMTEYDDRAGTDLAVKLASSYDEHGVNW